MKTRDNKWVPEIQVGKAKGDGHDHLVIAFEGRVVGYFHLIQGESRASRASKTISVNYYDISKEVDRQKADGKYLKIGINSFKFKLF